MSPRHVPALLISTCLLATPAIAQVPEDRSLDAWITISGIVSEPTARSFVLDYGTGEIIVEMDDWDWYPEGYRMLAGDEVTVYGRVDDELLEARSIEAASVYVEDLNTYFYASASDEEEALHTSALNASVPMGPNTTRATGIVSGIDGTEIRLDTGTVQFAVETGGLPYDPLDDEGYQQIDIGDRISVVGTFGRNFYGPKRELDAVSITTLQEDAAKRLASR